MVNILIGVGRPLQLFQCAKTNNWMKLKTRFQLIAKGWLAAALAGQDTAALAVCLSEWRFSWSSSKPRLPVGLSSESSQKVRAVLAARRLMTLNAL
jgi:hypothetical protein